MKGIQIKEYVKVLTVLLQVSLHTLTAIGSGRSYRDLASDTYT